MRKTKLITFLIFINLWILVFSFFLYSVEVSFSAEAQRIGNNVISESAKPYQIFHNPAGIRNITNTEIFFDYSMLYNNLSDDSKFINNTLGVVNNFKNHYWGIGINQFGLKDWYTKDGMFLSYAKEVRKIFPKIVLGGKINIISERYVLDEYMISNPVFAGGNSKTSLALSLGSQLVRENNVIGLLVENINQPDVGFYTVENLPMEIKLGYKHSLESMNFFSTLGIIINSVKLQNWVGVAGEYNFILFKILKFTPSLGVNFGSGNYLMLYLGFSAQTEKFIMSYSITIDPLEKISFVVQHKISFGYRFAPVPIEKQTILKTEYDNIVTERENLINQIESLKREIKLLQETKSSAEKEKIKQKQPKIVEQPKKEQSVGIIQKISPDQLGEQKSTSVITETVEEKQGESNVPTTEQILLEKIQSLEQKLKEVEKKKTEPVKPVLVTPTTQPVPQEQKQPLPKKRFHTVVAGDTLPSIAQKYYGDSSKWKIIYEANKDKIVRGQLLPGTVLEIP